MTVLKPECHFPAYAPKMMQKAHQKGYKNDATNNNN